MIYSIYAVKSDSSEIWLLVGQTGGNVDMNATVECMSLCATRNYFANKLKIIIIAA
jgi:hypothetical protein